jgi:hypothetical protein
VKYFAWDDAKNAKLRKERASGSRTSCSTLSVATCSTSCSIRTPSVTRVKRIFVVRREEYVYLVPFIEDDYTVFLKTIIPSRKATKHFLAGEEFDDED